MKTILFVHQSSELYGSDKTLLQLVSGLNQEKFYPIVVLPTNGPLKTELEKHQITVIEAPVLKLYRNIFTPKNILKAINNFRKGYKALQRIKKDYSVEIIYSNTLAVLIGFLFCFISKTKHIWHVHEILESPSIIAKIYRFLLNSKSNTTVIFNSKATQQFWHIKTPNTVVWNGIEPYIKSEKEINFKSKIGFNSNDIVLALVGRISRWKGQQLLLSAFYELQKKYSNCKLLLVGSTPFGQEFLAENLKQKIGYWKLEEKVKILPFQKNIQHIWENIDIAIVPSTEPEPFGMVAIEAMMAAKPVIGANHGGLQEIIINNETGLLFIPNNKADLLQKLEHLINHSELQKRFGKNGLHRAQTLFSTKKYVNSIKNIIIAI